ncbi:uncharacterized protein LOC126997069 isoform X2 [Eriocheir sinensis]|uniref:uncharacterized protein LOC126997069 isoform X2 n=1 Tax=Eriocheir sinensis TaxID=95602 RepID=UPI0021CA1B1E|nr:uncharacterized protein LOC126997069 isoform X2 [Eriocheir sinensis]
MLWWWRPRGAAGVLTVVWGVLLASWAQAEETVDTLTGLNVEALDNLPSGVQDALAYIENWSMETSGEGGAGDHMERRTSMSEHVNSAAESQNALEDTYVEDHHHGRPQHSSDKEQNHGRPHHGSSKDHHHGRPQHSSDKEQNYGRPQHSSDKEQNYGRPQHSSDKEQSHGRPHHGSSKDDHHGRPQHSSDQEQKHGRPHHGSSKGDHHGRPQHSSDQEQKHGRPHHGSSKDDHHGRPQHTSDKEQHPPLGHGLDQQEESAGHDGDLIHIDNLALLGEIAQEHLMAGEDPQDDEGDHSDAYVPSMSMGGKESPMPGYETEEPMPAHGAEESMPGYETEEPMLGHGAEQPMPGYGTEAPIPGYETEQPMPGYETEQPMPGYETEQPMPGYETEQPMPGYETEQPMPGYETEQPMPGYETEQPMPGYETEQPMPGYETEQPMPGYETEQPMPGYETEQPMPGYETEQPMPGYETEQPMPGYETEQPMPGYETEQPMPGYETEQPMPGYETEQPMPGYGGEENNMLETANAYDYINVLYDDEVSTFDVDEKDIPTTHPAEEWEAEESTGEGFEEEALPALEDDGMDVDMDGELSKLNIRAGDLLSGLDKETLGAVLATRLKWLKNKISQLYIDELKHFDHTRNRIDKLLSSGLGVRPPPATARSMVPHTAQYGKDPYSAPYGKEPYKAPYGEVETGVPRQDGESWQPYIFDTGVGNRQDIKIEGVDVEGKLHSVNIAKVLPVSLPGISVIYVDDDWFGYVEVEGSLQRLGVLNQWTRSPSGCPCKDGRNTQGCACCVSGGCQCPGPSDLCVACGTEYSSCKDVGHHGVRVSAVATSSVSAQDGSLLRLNVLAVAHGSSVAFFSHLGGAVLKLLDNMTLQQEVTHLAFGTTFTDHDEATEESTFLVVFSSGVMDHQFNEIIVSSMAPSFSVGPPVKWQGKGRAMKAHQGDGWVLVSVHGDNYVHLYTLQEDKWMRHHMIRKHTIKGVFHNWLVFRMEFQTYIAFAAQRHIAFYRWNNVEDEVEQMNTIYLGEALSNIGGLVAVNVESCQEDVAVVVAGHDRNVAVIALKHNFTTSVMTFVMEFRGSLQVSVDWSIAAHYSRGTSKIVVVESGTRQAIVVHVRTTVMELEHPMSVERESFDNTIQYIKRENEQQQAVVAAAEARLAKSVLFSDTVSADVTITGSLTVLGELSTGRMSAVRLVFPGTDLEAGVTHLEYLQYISSAQPRQDLSKQLLQDITTIENTLAFAVPASGPNRTIEGLKTIVTTNRLVLNTLTTQTISVGELRDENGAVFSLDTIMSSIVRAGQTNRLVRGRKTFASRLTVQHLNTGFLDDIPTGDLVTASGQHSVAGAVFPNGLWVQEMTLRPGGTLGGVDLSQAVLLGTTAVLGRVTVSAQELVAGSVEVASGLVGGVDLARLYNHTLLVTGGEVAGSLHFTTDLTVDELDAGFMMGVDMRRLAEDVVYRDEDAVLMGKLTIGQTVTVEGDMTTGTINGRKFPDDYAVKIGTSPLVFTKEVSFGHVTFGELSFGPQGVVDGIAPHRLVTKTGDQTVQGRKVFSAGVDINGHLDISTKLLDGVNLDDLFSRGGRPSSIPTDWRFNLICRSDVTIHRLVTQGTVNGVDLSALAQDLVYKNEQQVRITGRKVFLKGLTVTNAIFKGGFNGVDLGSLVTTDTDLTVSGVFTFTRDVSFRTLVANRVDGVHLSALFANALYLNKAGQVITGRKVFLRPVVVGSLAIKGSLKGIDFSNLVTKSGNQTFTAPQVFNSADFAFLSTNSIQMAQGLKINGVDLSELARRRVPLREPVSHTATLTIEGLLEVAGTASIEILNGVNLDELLSTVVTDDGDYTIDGPVSLSTLRVLGSVTTQGGVGGSGVSLRDVASNAISLSANNQISGLLSFMRVEVRGEVGVDGLVEGVHLGRLHQDAVYVDVQSLQTITGAKMFSGGFAVRGDIHARTVNDLDLSKSLFTRTTDQVITAPFAFLHVAALKNVFLQGNFNSFDLKALAQDSIMRGKNEEIVTEDITFSSQVTVKNLVLLGALDDLDLNAILSDAVRLKDTAITITGKKTLMTGLTFENLHVELLNGQRLDHFLASVVTRNRPHTLTGAVRVRGTIIAPWVTAQQLVVQGTIDGVDLQDFRQKVVFLTGHQTVDASVVFAESLSVRNNLQTVFLNDVNLSQGYLTISTDQTFNVNFTISSAHATHVEVGGLVNSWNLPQEWNRTLLGLGGQNMLGSMTLTLSGRLVVDRDVVVTGRVGRERMVKLSQQVVLLDQRTQVSGVLSFSVPLTVAWLRSSTGIVNGVDLEQLYRSAWFVDTNTQISTSVFFHGGVIMRELISQGTIDGLEIQLAYAAAKAARDGFRNITLEFEDKFEKVCLPIAKLYNKLEACMYEADYLVFHSGLPLTAVPHESITFYAFGTTVLLVSYEGACHLDFLSWHNDSFVLRQRVQHAGFGRHFHLLQEEEGKVLVAMAASAHDNTCEATNTTIWQVTTSGLQVYQILGEGVYITEGGYGENTLLLHGPQYTLAYTLDVHTRRWSHAATLPVHAGGVLVHPEYGVLHLLRDYTNTTTYVLRAVSATSRGGSKLLFALYSTITSCCGPLHALKVFREVDGIQHCVAEAKLPTLPADLTVFFAGSKAAGAYLAVVTFHFNYLPIIFTFSGEVLTRWAEVEDAPSATWVEHALVRRPGRHFPDYHILFSPLLRLPTHHTTTPTTPPTIPPISYTPPTVETTTKNPYNPYTTPNPYTLPPHSTPGPYNPYTNPTHGPYNPYTNPTPGPYNPYTNPTPGPYNPYTNPQSTQGPYNPYTPPTGSPHPNSPYTSTPNPHGYTAPGGRYVRSAYPISSDESEYSIGAIFRLVMRGSAVAAANITC